MRALLVLLVAVLLVPPADAQGRLLDRAKRAVERAVSDRDREVETPPAVATPQAPPTEAAPAAVPAPAAAPASDPMPPTGPMPTTAAGIAPAMDWLHWARTLSDVRVEQEEPAVRVFPLSDQILFPVEGVTYQRVLRHADSRLVDWEEVELIVHPTLPAFGTLISDRPFGLEAHLEPGHYRAVVTANGHEIGALPFEVFRLTSGDGLYDSRATFGARGPWNDLGVLNLKDRDVEFRFWLPGSTHDEPEGGRLLARLYKGSTVLNEEDGARVYVSTPVYPWRDRWVTFSSPPGPMRSTPMIDRLTDGEYRIEVAEKDQRPIRVYRFRVSGGEVVPHTRSALDHTPRADFLTPRSVNTRDISPTTIGPRDGRGAGHIVWVEAD
jgi:hypothetical protein